VARDVVERILAGYAAFNRGNFDQALEGMPEDVEWVAPESFLEPGPHRGPEGVRRFWEAWRESFETFTLEIEDVHDLGEHLVVIARIHGTGRDSGAPVTTPTFPHVWTLDGDQVTRMEMFTSSDAAAEAIGRDWR
jgi:ketosteroid isomerase-like protein